MSKNIINDAVIIEAEYMRETPKSYFLNCEGDPKWFPKSQVNFDADKKDLELPRWLAKKNISKRKLLIMDKKKRPVRVKTKKYVTYENRQSVESYDKPGYYDFNFNGLFHQFGEEAVEDSVSGFGNFTVGIVEDESGQVHTVNPNDIKFLDK